MCRQSLQNCIELVIETTDTIEQLEKKIEREQGDMKNMEEHIKKTKGKKRRERERERERERNNTKGNKGESGEPDRQRASKRASQQVTPSF